MTRTATEIRDDIDAGRTAIGIELGSTRIKAVLIGPDHQPLASGSHDWENALVDGVWTYSLDDVRKGLVASFAALATRVAQDYGTTLATTGALGVSAMMHGYLAFDAAGELLAPFRTWRNNRTGEAAEELTALLGYPIPQRWSIAHLGQAILDGEPHVKRLARLTTLSGYIHWKLTGRFVLGVGDASGMFPVDPATHGFDARRVEKFDRHIAAHGYPWKLAALLPEVLVAGQPAGTLTPEGAALLDPSGTLRAGIPMCPPEGDAGTGMVATDSIAVRTGNVSAGTSVFAMIVLEKELSRVYPELDLVTTPEGNLVAMAHSNNCSSDTDAWIALFGEAARALGADVSKATLYDVLLGRALEGDADAGGLLSYGYVSGEHLTGFAEGRPLFVRAPDSRFTLANFMRANLFSALGALRIGLDRLFVDESVVVDEIRGHGGFFKTREVGQRIMAAATGVPVSVLETAGEGGAWGIALMAAYLVRRSEGETLDDYLDQRVFAGRTATVVRPEPHDRAGFDAFFARYKSGLEIERAAVDHLE